jgi:hypothetical protein
MFLYQDTDGDSGIRKYLPAKDSITIEFKEGAIYLYTYASTGKRHIDAMKKLAAKGSGLTTYINQHVRDHYAEKLS